MACRPAGLLPRSAQSRLIQWQWRRHAAPPVCPFCSLAQASVRPRPRAARRGFAPRRRCQSVSAPEPDPRAELERILLELQRRFPSLVNLPRLQLALQGLRRPSGHEPIRIAVLGLAHDSRAASTAKSLLRTLLADPLVDEAAWEKALGAHDANQPLVIRVAPSERSRVNLQISSDTTLRELHVSSPALNGLNLEFLLTRVSLPPVTAGPVSVSSLEDAVLVPAVDVPSAEDGPPRLVTTPVHRALLVADGFSGAVDVSALPASETGDAVKTAVHLRGFSGQQLEAAFDVIDVSLADEGIRLFRQGPQNAMDYERLWYASNLPALVAWLKAGAAAPEGATKPAVKRLVASLLQATASSIKVQGAPKPPSTRRLGDLDDRLARWAQQAHAELQNELDLAFTGRRWRKLGWWKLFWRVDDVAMLTNEMLSQRFMPTAEQELVYLAGRIAQAGNNLPRYPQPASARKGDEKAPPKKHLGPGEHASAALPKWPGHIAFTRRYLQHETVPALQALAQRLVMQSLGTSGVMTSLAALLYVSSLTSTLYEAGAVAALGVVYSLGRMQKKWETARSFWEGEVREEGRKAVRGAEESVAAVLQAEPSDGVSAQETEMLDKARDLVAAAEDALARMK